MQVRMWVRVQVPVRVHLTADPLLGVGWAPWLTASSGSVWSLRKLIRWRGSSCLKYHSAL